MAGSCNARHGTRHVRRGTAVCAAIHAHSGPPAFSILTAVVLMMAALFLPSAPARAGTTVEWSRGSAPVVSEATPEGLASTAEEAHADRIIVRLETAEDLQRIEGIARGLGLVVQKTLPQLRAALLARPTPPTDSTGNVLPERLPHSLVIPPDGFTKAAAQLREARGVVSVEFDTLQSIARLPNDPAYSLQW